MDFLETFSSAVLAGGLASATLTFLLTLYYQKQKKKRQISIEYFERLSYFYTWYQHTLDYYQQALRGDTSLDEVSATLRESGLINYEILNRLNVLIDIYLPDSDKLQDSLRSLYGQFQDTLNDYAVYAEAFGGTGERVNSRTHLLDSIDNQKIVLHMIEREMDNLKSRLRKDKCIFLS